MSKRAAETQRDGATNSFMDVGEGQETAQRATSAQMANRQIRAIRSSRRAGAPRRPGLTDSPSRTMPQAAQTPLGNVDPNTANGTQQQKSLFQFGSQSFGGTPQPKSNDTQPASPSASFPSFGNNINTSSSFQFAPPNSGFNFAPGPGTSINNPFASLAKDTGTPSLGTHQAGYQGSLFNIPAQAPPPQATLAQTTLAQPTPESNSADPDLDRKNPTLYGQQSLFDQLAQQRRLATGNPFSKSQTSQSADIPDSNPFASIQVPETKPSSGIFEQKSTPSIQQLTNKNASGQAQSSDQATLEGDSMSTTPDTSPQTKDRTPPNPFASINFSASPTPQTNGKNLFLSKSAVSGTGEKTVSSAPPLQGRSLFDRTPLPATVNGQVSSTSPKAEPGKQGESLFDRISRPNDPNAHIDIPTGTAPSAPTNVFTGFGQPVNPTNTTDRKDPEKEDRHVAKSFSALSQNATSTPNLGSSLFSSKTPPVQLSHPFAQEATPPAAYKAVEATPQSSIEVADAPRSPTSSRTNITDQRGDGSIESFDSAIGSPPFSSVNSSEEVKRSHNTLWRLKALSAGIKKLCAQVSESEIPRVIDYYNERRQAIVAAAGRPLTSAAGSKRHSPQDGHELSSAKRSEVGTSLSDAATIEPQANSALTNGVNASHQINNQASSAKYSSPGKRKADDDPPNNPDEGTMNAAKKTRVEGTISSPSLTSASSETSNIFKSIVNNSGPGPFGSTPKSLTNGTNSAQDFSGSRGNSRPAFPAPESSPKDATETPKASSASLFPSATFTQQTSLFNQSNSSNPTAPLAGVASPFKFTGTTTSPTPVSPAKTATEKPTFQPPKFGSGAPVNFMSQFRKAVDASEEREKAKRKAEEFDSDEDNEDDWERKDAEAQIAKKQKLGESLQGKAAKFVPGQGFVFASIEQGNEVKKDAGSDEAESRGQSRASSVSVFDQPRQPLSNGLNIFGHLSDVESGTDGGRKGDADDEGPDSESSDEDEQAEPQKSTSGGRSLFDRISNDENGNPIKELPGAEEKKTNNIFGNLMDQYNVATPNSKASAQPFSGFDLSKSSSSTSKSNIFGPPSEKIGNSDGLGTETSPGDHTWKADSPIKFGGTSAAPSVHITSPSPSKSPFGGLFGSSNTGGSLETATASASSPVGTLSSKGPGVGFGIAFDSKPAGSSLAPPSDTTANDSSRATSPGASSAGDSLDESAEDRGNEEQIDLTKGPGEEDEENLFEVRGKALTYDNKKKEWVNKGVGPLRVLKHPETGKTRILLRQDPSGRITINTALLSGIDYEYAAPKSVKVAVAMDNGTLATYMIRVGKDEDAKELAKILQENRTN